MWEVYLWVPARGWKLIRKFMAKDQLKAVDCALEFVPLEVKLSRPGHGDYYSGAAHTRVPYDIPLMTQIEDLKESLAAGVK